MNKVARHLINYHSSARIPPEKNRRFRWTPKLVRPITRKVDCWFMAGVIIGVVFIVFALALLIPGLLAALGRLPGNNVVGLHVPEVRKDEEIWVQAHKVAGPYLILGGLALAFGAAFSFIAEGWLWAGPVILALVAIASVAAAGNQGARAAKLFAQAKDNDTDAAAAVAQPAPQVDLGALRNAARRADDR